MNNEPFITIDNIPRAASSYSWGAKMHICNKYAMRAMDGGRRCRVENMKTTPAPWELNELAAFLISSTDGECNEMPENLFRMMVNAVREGIPRCLFGGIEEVKRYLSFTIAMQQIPYQQDALIAFFRYRYLFSSVDIEHGLDMPRRFRETFGVDSEDVLALSALIYLAASQNIMWVDFIRDFRKKFDCRLSLVFKNVLDLISIDRTEFARRQTALFELSSDGPSNAQNLLERYPVIINGGNYYLPLPYLLNFATTRHMFDRLMDANKELRKLVGLWGMEPYVRELFEKSHCYDKVEGSFQYKRGRDTVDSPDVWIQSDADSIFVEVKLAEAPIELRQMFVSQVEKTCELSAKHVFQLFSRIKEICGGLARKTVQPLWENVYGVVVIHEDSFMVREEIYKQCFATHPSLTDSEREFIRTRISVVGLYSIEQFCYHHCSILPALKEREKEHPGAESIMLNVDFLSGSSPDFPFDEVFMPIAKEIPSRLFAPNDSGLVLAS